MTSSQEPRLIAEGGYWRSVAADSNRSCAIQHDGAMWCWGRNRNGQLGLGDRVDRDEPQQVVDDTDWSGVFMGAHHAHGLRTDGSGWSWGGNLFGQLGDGLAWVAEPKLVSDPTDN